MSEATTQPLLARILTDLGIMTVIGVILGLIGPLGSFNDPLALRLVVWIAFAWLGYALYAPVDTFAVRLAPTLQLHVWALRIVGVFIASVPMALAVFLIPRSVDKWRWPGLDFAMTHYLYVVMIGGLITLVNTLIRRPGTAQQANQMQASVSTINDPSPRDLAAATLTPANPLLDQLPAELGSDVIALEMEDHYVRVHTALGSQLVLMRLRDAMVHLVEFDGMQVHRSWWVARGAVEDVQREGRTVRLKLANEVEAPVSRANVSVLKEAGWI